MCASFRYLALRRARVSDVEQKTQLIFVHASPGRPWCVLATSKTHTNHSQITLRSCLLRELRVSRSFKNAFYGIELPAVSLHTQVHLVRGEGGCEFCECVLCVLESASPSPPGPSRVTARAMAASRQLGPAPASQGQPQPGRQVGPPPARQGPARHKKETGMTNKNGQVT